MSNNSVTRIEIAEKITKEMGISRSESSFFVDSIIDEMVKSLVNKNLLKISSFGTLKTRFKKERIGRNPKTGVEATISSRTTISFIPSKVLKNKINKNY